MAHRFEGAASTRSLAEPAASPVPLAGLTSRTSWKTQLPTCTGVMPASGDRASFSQAEECVPWSARDIRAQPVAHAILQDEAVHVAYADQTQASFLDGHVRAFHAIGGGADRDDPLRQLEACGNPGRVGSGTVRAPQIRGAALALRVRLVLLRPRLDGVHEEGGVEGEIGRFRRRHLTPFPHVGSLAALNKALAAADARDDTAGSAPGSRPSGRPPPAQLSVGCPAARKGGMREDIGGVYFPVVRPVLGSSPRSR